MSFREWLRDLWRTKASTATSKATAQPEVPGKVEGSPATRPVPPAHQRVEHLLPLRWSLYYALAKSEWAELRQRHREQHPTQEQCSCPNGCRTNTLDELWTYDSPSATKRFLVVQCLCTGCHWLKSPTWRLETWIKEQQGLLPPLTKPPHIIDCLGWTPRMVAELRAQDLVDAERQKNKLRELQRHQQRGEVLMVPCPWRRLPPPQRRALVRTGKRIVMIWDVDLSELSKLGYTPVEVNRFTRKMLDLGRTRMQGDLR